jgi:plasmid segregation protein ParM
MQMMQSTKQETEKMKKPILVAIDGGSGNVAVRYVDDNGEVKSSILPSLVRRGLMQQGNLDSTSAWTTDDGETYSVTSGGSRMELIDTCDPQYQLSAANRVLVHDALAKAGLSGREVIIADTLPADQFFGDNGKLNLARIEAKKESRLRPVKNHSGKVAPAIIKQVVIYPEAVPAYVSVSMITDDGEPNPALDGVNNVIVVDLGQFTCDIARLDKDNNVLTRLTTEHGIHVMTSHLNTLLQENEEALGLAETKEISPAALKLIIQNGYIGSSAVARKSQRVYVTELIKQAASRLADDIKADIRTAHRNTSDIDAIIFVGGGANWLSGHVEWDNGDSMPDYTKDWHSYVITPEQPEFAIVRGVHLLMQAQMTDITEA